MAASVRLIKALGGDWNVARLPTPEAVAAGPQPGPRKR
jgi:hypothetical protein